MGTRGISVGAGGGIGGGHPAGPAVAATQALATRVLGANVLYGLSQLSSAAADPNATMQIGVAPANPDPTGELTLYRSLCSPGSANYRQFLTPAAFNTAFGVDAGTYQQATAWLRSSGLTVDSTVLSANYLLTSYPASSPYAVAVGGIVLYTTGTPASRLVEYAWTFTGGGDSLLISAPAYQRGTQGMFLPAVASAAGQLTNTGQPCRGVPDVAAQSGDALTNGFTIVAAGVASQGSGTNRGQPHHRRPVGLDGHRLKRPFSRGWLLRIDIVLEQGVNTPFPR